MFNQEKEKNVNLNNKEAETVIGLSVKVKGDFVCQGSMIIEGTVEGNLKTENDLYVGEKSKITADIKAKNAKISGFVQGNLDIDGFLELTSTAKIQGNVNVKSLSIAKGASLNGICTMSNQAAQTEK